MFSGANSAELVNDGFERAENAVQESALPGEDLGHVCAHGLCQGDDDQKVKSDLEDIRSHRAGLEMLGAQKGVNQIYAGTHFDQQRNCIFESHNRSHPFTNAQLDRKKTMAIETQPRSNILPS